MNPYIIPALALGATLVGGFAALLVKMFSLGRDVGVIKQGIEQTAHLAGYVPQLYSDVENIKKHLAISTPQMPSWIHGHDAEE